jgi:hypothetical protein
MTGTTSKRLATIIREVADEVRAGRAGTYYDEVLDKVCDEIVNALVSMAVRLEEDAKREMNNDDQP